MAHLDTDFRGFAPSDSQIWRQDGDEMAPAIRHGERVTVDANVTLPREAGMYIVVEEGGTHIRRVAQLGQTEKVWLVAQDNPMKMNLYSGHPPHVLGKLRALFHLL